MFSFLLTLGSIDSSWWAILKPLFFFSFFLDKYSIKDLVPQLMVFTVLLHPCVTNQMSLELDKLERKAF